MKSNVSNSLFTSCNLMMLAFINILIKYIVLLLELMNLAIESGNVDVSEVQEDLIIDEFGHFNDQSSDECECLDDSEESSQGSSTSSYHPSPDRKRPHDEIREEDKQRAVAFWKSGKTKKLSLTTVQKSFSFVTSLVQLYRWEKLQPQTSSAKVRKLIYSHVYQKFLQAREQGYPVHDEDLRIWALEYSNVMQFSDFKASSKWIKNFKRKFNIVSRKVTRFVGRKSTQDTTERAAAIASFRAEICQIASDCPEGLYNTDQSGFQKEMHSGRSLEKRGAKKVEAVAQSKSCMTHSYTIQPVISADGRLFSPMLIVLQEPQGVLGPRVTKTMFKARNLHVEASKSGKFVIFLLLLVIIVILI